MVTINLPRPWTYRTPEKTIDYPAGEHEVFQYIADRAEKDGALADKPERTADPLDSTVEELAAYLATIDDRKAIEALLKAEQAGKTRKTAIEALNARLAEL
jgi:hypothetical protein